MCVPCGAHPSGRVRRVKKYICVPACKDSAAVGVVVIVVSQWVAVYIRGRQAGRQARAAPRPPHIVTFCAVGGHVQTARVVSHDVTPQWQRIGSPRPPPCLRVRSRPLPSCWRARGENERTLSKSATAARRDRGPRRRSATPPPSCPRRSRRAVPRAPHAAPAPASQPLATSPPRRLRVK